MINELEDQYSSVSFSQEGEDLILGRIFERKENGFYVDVGAYHPVRFSNTLYFYKKGWRGINIEPRPGALELFNSLRPRDINIQVAVSNSNKELDLYIFNEEALNTFSPELAEQRSQIIGYEMISRKKIRMEKLSDLLTKYLPDNQSIDFLTIDTEGFDLEVLESNDWERYSPQIVVTEMLEYDFDKILNSKLFSFLNSKGYRFFAKTFNSLFFRK